VHVDEHNDFKTNIEVFGAELYFNIGVKIVIYNIYFAYFNSHIILFEIQSGVYSISSIKHLTWF